MKSPISGKITKYFSDRKFGFIAPDEGPKDFFFRADEFEGDPTEGLRVSFYPNKGPKGETATQIKIIKDLIPPECVFDSFYRPDQSSGESQLKEEIFFDSAQKAAVYLEKAGLSSSSLRMLFQAFQSFASPLSCNQLIFPKAKELFSKFYVERVVRQNKRGMIPDAAFEFFDQHREVIMSSNIEMLGFFRYLTNVLCYFGDQVKK